MSQIKVKNNQIGIDTIATNNFTLGVPSTPDGTLRLSRGNPGAIITDIFTVGADNSITFNQIVNNAYGNSGAASYRNRIRNGDMFFNQRGTISATATSSYFVDGWQLTNNTTLRLTASQQSGGPPGFQKFARVTTTTAGAPAVGDQYGIFQPIEGSFFNDLQWGTSTAATMIVSFWVRASIAGNYQVSIISSAASQRSYATPYTVNNANTWEQKFIVIPGDITGTWTTDISRICYFVFACGFGSNNQVPVANTWTAGSFVGVSGGVQMTNTNGATFDITGVQFERGSVATPFEWMPVDFGLTRQQRYLYSSYSLGVTPGTGDFTAAWTAVYVDANNVAPMGRFPVALRSPPSSLTIYNPSTGAGSSLFDRAVGSSVTITGSTAATTGIWTLGSSGGYTAGRTYGFHVFASAEL